MKQFPILIFVLIHLTSYCQYPFEKYPEPVYQEFQDWKIYDWTETKQTINHTITINNFFDHEPLTVQLTSSTENLWENSSIRMFRGNEQIQKLLENTSFSRMKITEPIRIADFNGDGLKDLKLIIPYMGVGIASFNVRVIYLIQNSNNTFVKISFNDKMNQRYNRSERDFDGDRKFEVITMKLDGHENHNYWTFNIFEFTESGLTNANEKDDYPIMIQLLYEDNYGITNKISRENMKLYSLELPEEYDLKK